jgi:hypothetical protein
LRLNFESSLFDIEVDFELEFLSSFMRVLTKLLYSLLRYAILQLTLTDCEAVCISLYSGFLGSLSWWHSKLPLLLNIGVGVRWMLLVGK